jgi:hypothetical protein
VTTPSVFLPVDLTGAATDNFISGEYHRITSGAKTIIRPNFGDFYSHGVQLYGVSSETSLNLLRLGIDYDFAHLNEDATAQSDGAVYQAIVLKNTRFFTTFSVSYHAFGGARNINYTRLYNLYLEAKNGSPTPYANLTGVPSSFQPVVHDHDALDVYGLEYVTAFIDNIKNSMNVSRTGEARYTGVRLKLRAFETELQLTSTALPVAARQHVDNTGFAHSYTKAMIGLGNVANYAFVPLTIEGVTYPAYASPQVLFFWTNNPPDPDPPAHVALTNNPHGENKADVGLPLLQNLAFQPNYTQGIDLYETLISGAATEVYLGPAPFAWGVTEYADHVYAMVTQPLVDQVVTDANAKIGQATTILSSVATVQGSINTLINPLQVNVVNIDRRSQQAVALNSRFNIVHGNAKYSETLIQLLLQEREAFARQQSVYDAGYFPIPQFLDGLELWLSANNPKNELLMDMNNNLRVTKLVDMSSRQRVYAAPANTAPILAVSQDVTDEVQGISDGMVLKFSPGMAMDQLSGPVMQLRTGMTVIALVRPGEAGSRLNLLTAPNAVQETGIYGYTTTGQLLAIRSGSPWKPLEAPAATAQPETSGIVVGVVSDDSERYCWLASTVPLNYIPYPRGVNTPPSSWPSLNYRSAALTQLGNANFGINNEGEVAELLIFRRALRRPEVRAVVEYLKTRYANGAALSVDYAALNAF